ncbi:MAG: ABC transporter ATP-binding protein [Clostridiales bacterium]|jgi:branched-chain amino acid transport system ATP-binding protein|nr:ABC transporter ATP-binding protein [Clostridiales bacterium]
MLKIEHLSVHYGGIQALRDVSLEIPEGKLITLIGANGAGKSTALRSIMRLVKPAGGKISYNGEDLTGLNTQQIVSRGITLVPEGRRVFADLSVLENLKIGAYLRKGKEEIKRDIDYVFSLFPRLGERSWQQAGTLSGGEQQMLALGRALMSKPKLMMMDEPSLGLAPIVVSEIFNIIRKLSGDGITILLIEQNAHSALAVADYGYVLETGEVRLEGAGQELLDSEHVKELYLGKHK